MPGLMKAFLIALPLAIVMYVVLIAAGYLLWGDEWNMQGLPFVSLATGFVAFTIAKNHLRKLPRDR